MCLTSYICVITFIIYVINRDVNEEIIEVYFLFIVLGSIYHNSLYFMGFILL